MSARCLLTRRERPSSRSVICSLSSAARSVERLRLPLGRPFGFPDFPFLNWVCLGGLAVAHLVSGHVLKYPLPPLLAALPLFHPRGPPGWNARAPGAQTTVLPGSARPAVISSRTGVSNPVYGANMGALLACRSLSFVVICRELDFRQFPTRRRCEPFSRYHARRRRLPQAAFPSFLAGWPRYIDLAGGQFSWLP
jgi:hypothetical protein